jgi:YidC/Oxa1 family membrane protein insertase
MSFIFNAIFYKPLLNGLVWLISVLPFHDVGFAVIILTIFVRIITFPLNQSSIATQNKIKQIEPEIRQIKERFKNDNQEQAKKTMELYKKNGISPFSGIISLIVQIPIIFALYRVFLGGLNFDPAHLYPFIKMPSDIHLKFLGLIDMAQKNYFLAILTGLSQFFQMKIAMPAAAKSDKRGSSFKDDLAKSMNLQFKYVMPVFIFLIVSRLSSAVGLYWTTMNIFAIIQEIFFRKKWKKGLKNGAADKNN